MQRPGTNRKPLRSTVSIAEVAEQTIKVEVCDAIEARFAGGPSFDLSDRQRNPFYGWKSDAVTINAYRIRDVELDPILMVFFKEGRLIAETNYLQSEASLAEAWIDPQRLVTVRPGAAVATCFDHWDHNYYHWMTHSIPAIEAARQGAMARSRLLMPQVRPWQQRSLDLLSVDQSLYVPTDREHQYSIPEIWYCDYVAGRADFTNSRLSRAAYERMGATIAEPSSKGRRIYIDRTATSNRAVPNEEALVARLAEMGFEIVRPEMMSLDEQIALFRSASMVVAQLGAGLSNIVFCRPGTVVYELLPSHHQNPCFLAMAVQGGLEYWGDVFDTGVSGEDHESSWLRGVDVDHVVNRVTELARLIPGAEQIRSSLAVRGAP